ncbi:light and oxygen sensing histidine kinase [Haloferax elongans ATCC BAA-1513]|uniref:histidine kinase n=1 Tax=Haloferax elongans ATCC BAA-1513 TaxID=1230453 RepID=M0HNH0_HALEO|nr:PAS domain-containing protein [Haloferax elongans]ELZ86125.1 light and oxygen sensing histidine kinase [Haloferax elongans ATCC BAA-1513]
MDGLEDRRGQPICVLYVDDDAEFAEVVETELPRIDSRFDVTLAGTVDEVFETLAAQPVDCVVTASSLGEQTGIDLVDSVRKSDENLPTILCTDGQHEQLTPREYGVGVSDHVTIHVRRDTLRLLASAIGTLVDASRATKRADETIDRFRRTLERATDAVYSVDTEWRIEYLNQKMAERVGCDPDAVMGSILWEEFPSIVGTELETKYRTAMETGEPVSFEQYLEPPFDYWVEIRAFPDDDGLTVFSREITHEREQTHELERSKAILEQVHDVVFVLDSSFDIQYANPSAARARGGPDEMRGMNILDIVDDRVPDEDLARFREAVSKTVSRTNVRGDGAQTGLYDTDLQVTFDAADGPRTFDVRLTPLTETDEDRVLVVGRDVTSHQEIKRQLERERDALQAVQRVMGDADLSTDERLAKLLDVGRWTLDLDVGIVSDIGGSDYVVRAVSPAGGGVSVGDRFDLESTYCEAVVASDEVCSFVDAVEAGRESHPAYREFELESYIGAPLSVDGERFGTVNFSSPNSRDVAFGEIERTFVELLGELVSAELAREQSRCRLEQTNQRLESLIQAAPMAIMEVDEDGHVHHWNHGAEAMFGWTSDEVVGEQNPLIPEDKTDEFEIHRKQTFSGDRIRGKEVRRQTKSGEVRDYLLSTAPVESADGDIDRTIAVLEDITRQKALEANLRALQQTTQELSIASSVDDIAEIAVDAAATVLDLDVTSIWQYDDHREMLVPLTETSAARGLYGETPPLTPGESLAWDAFEAGEVRAYDDIREYDNRYNDDTEIRSEIIVPLGQDGLLLTGSTSPHEFNEQDVDLFRILASSVGAALVRAKREGELRQQNERLDQFASVVSHDLRNPLSVATGFLEIAEETGEKAYFEKVESAHERIEDLIDDLLSLARGERPVEDGVDVGLDSIANEAWEYVDTADATLSVGELPTITGDPSRLKQLFENLFRNAAEHSGDDVSITVDSLDRGHGFYVEDDGVGIPPTHRENIFEHGVSYSRSGTGFGLSIVAAIARAHGWTVTVTDGADGGARFEFEPRRIHGTASKEAHSTR